MSTAQSNHLANGLQTEFLRTIDIDYGPAPLLGKLFLKAAAELSAIGLTLMRISPQQLNSINCENRDSWRPLLPTFSPEFSELGDDNMICVGVADNRGRFVGTHAVRLLDWSQTTYGEELTSYRMLYADPARMKLQGESCSLTAGRAAGLNGRIGFSGAAWYHPDHRRAGLSSIIPRVGKALALATWNIDRILGIMAEEIHALGFAPRFGYHGVDWDFVLTGSRVGSIRFALIWIERPELEDYFASYLAGRGKVDGGVLPRDAQDMPRGTAMKRK